MNNSKWFFLFLFFISFSFVLKAQNWPYFRGPNGDGTSNEKNLPVSWDSVTNVFWKTNVPGIGYSSPVIWEDRLFTATAFPESQEKVLLCYDCSKGNLLWQVTVLKTPFEKKHNDNSHASGTPATDGKLVYVSFLDGKDVIVAAYDFDGNQVWIQRPGTFFSQHGFSCSPVLYNDKVIINGSSPGDSLSFFAALKKSNGDLVWKVVHENLAHSFSTPIIREMAGKTQVILCGNEEIAGYDPDTGFKYWFVRGPSKDFCSSPVYNAKYGLVIVSSAWPRRTLVAIKPDGKGDVTESHVVWSSDKGGVYVPSPVCTDEYVYTTMTNGQVYCTDVSKGDILWVEDMGKQYSSPVLADGLVYMPNDDGIITVIKPGPKPEFIAKNSIGEKMFASPVISNGKIYLRTYQHLYCIGNDKNLK